MKSSTRSLIACFAVLTLAVASLPAAHAQRFSFGGGTKGKSLSGGRSHLRTLGTSGLSKFHSINRLTTSRQGIRTHDLSQRHQNPNIHAAVESLVPRRQPLDYRPMVGRPSSPHRLEQVMRHFQAGMPGRYHSNSPPGIHDLIRQNQTHNKVCISNLGWCHAKPKHCHWWYNWCKPIRYCEPAHHVSCHWDYVQCDYVVAGRVVVADARWYLGLKGLFLPGKGVGIEAVTPGSPAAFVGLQPGMVITRCNGVDLFDEQVLEQVIAQSQGVLRLDLVLNDTGAPATCTVVMQRVANGQSF